MYVRIIYIKCIRKNVYVYVYSTVKNVVSLGMVS